MHMVRPLIVNFLTLNLFYDTNTSDGVNAWREKTVYSLWYNLLCLHRPSKSQQVQWLLVRWWLNVNAGIPLVTFNIVIILATRTLKLAHTFAIKPNSSTTSPSTSPRSSKVYETHVRSREPDNLACKPITCRPYHA